jgi:DNA helicase-2/ATP-dependent DNA helicase PcrA
LEVNMSFVPSPQQADFLNWVSNGSGSCILEAVAGAGKTTTILESIGRTGGNVAILAYNKKIADEISEKLKSRGIDWKQAQAGTVHSFGFKACRKAFPKVQVDGDKVSRLIVAEMGGKFAEAHPLYPARHGIAKLVSLAKQRAIGVLGHIEDTHLWYDIIDHFDLFSDRDNDLTEAEIFQAICMGQQILIGNNKVTDVIDFDDMVYLPLMRKVRFWRYDWVFVDEAQDTNPARRALVRAILAPGGRCVAVGDRHQAIYGFTGADADSLDLIAQDFNAARMPLTTTYRCPKKVVDFARRWVSHITAAETALEGEVSTIDIKDLLDRLDLDGKAAILCRNTKPLVNLAFPIIARGVPCKVEGREDIGAGLVKLATRWKRVTTLHGLEQALDGWEHREIAKALARKKEGRAQAIEDQCGTLRVIIEACRKAKTDSVAAVVARINNIFADNIRGMLTLSTIHKSKGREWDTVFWLDRENTLPSRYARQGWQLEQEHNLCYVAATRAQGHLIEVLV